MDPDFLKELIQREDLDTAHLKAAIGHDLTGLDTVLAALVDEIADLRGCLSNLKPRDSGSRISAAELGDYFRSNPDLVSGFSYRNGKLFNQSQEVVARDDLDLVALEQRLRLSPRFYRMPISFKDILIGIKRYFLSVAVSDRYQDECVREHIHSHAEACLGSSTTKRKTYVALSELRQLLPAYSKEDIRIALVESGWSFDQRSNRQWIFRKSGRK